MNRLLPPLALLVGFATAASAGEIRGRVLVDGKPAAGVSVSALPFEDGLVAARREARRERRAIARSQIGPGAGGSVGRLAFHVASAAARIRSSSLRSSSVTRRLSMSLPAPSYANSAAPCAGEDASWDE